MKAAKIWLPQTQEFIPCTVEDINLKGMRISSSEQLLQEDSFPISVMIEECLDFMKLDVSTSWHRPENGKHSYSIAFNRIMEKDKERLYSYLNENCFDQFKNKWWGNA